MNNKKFLLVFSMLVISISFAAARKKYSHQKYFQHYKGTKTCLKCHIKQAKQFFYSQHYQWKGVAPQIVDSQGKKWGKINTINDFCTNPLPNWIGFVYNSKGKLLSTGCSKCHTGLGKLPIEKPTRVQLENIDCLICHASGYRRDLYKNKNGSLEWRPILWQNQEGLDSVSKRISLPKRTMCLRCHSGSGGGPNWKRGDLEYALDDCEPEFDVHMASSGNDMNCIDCHQGQDHRVRGHGTDLSGNDMPNARLSCDSEECHGKTPHEAPILNHHTKRVYCTTCHITEFAKEDATDLVRLWSKPHYVKRKDKYIATITMGKNVKPVYAWYNGKTWEQLPGRPIKKLSDGTIGMMIPQGSRNDPNARIYAFKLHKATMPVLKGKNWILPIAVEEFFADGDIDKAVRKAAEEFYNIKNIRYYWVKTTRLMGLFHEVKPAKDALKCLDCHSPNGRLNWKALGYSGDPMMKLVAKVHQIGH